MRLHILLLLATVFIPTKSEAFYFYALRYKTQVMPVRCLRQSGSTCGLHSLYNASCFVKDAPRFVRNKNNFDNFFQESLECIENNYDLSSEVERAHFYLNQENLDYFIQNCDFCDVLQVRNNFSIISHIDAVEHVFTHKREYQDFLKAGGYSDLIRNIKNFQSGKSPYQVIIINDTKIKHWFVVTLARHGRLKKDFLLYADSLGIDRRKCNFIKRVYNLFTRII